MDTRPCSFILSNNIIKAINFLPLQGWGVRAWPSIDNHCRKKTNLPLRRAYLTASCRSKIYALETCIGLINELKPINLAWYIVSCSGAIWPSIQLDEGASISSHLHCCRHLTCGCETEVWVPLVEGFKALSEFPANLNYHQQQFRLIILGLKIKTLLITNPSAQSSS